MDSSNGELPQITRNSTANTNVPDQTALSSVATGPVAMVHVTPRESSLRSFRSILADPELSKKVTNVKFTTSEHPDKTTDDYRNEEVESELSEEYENAIKAVGQFPNLHAVYLESAAVCFMEDLETAWWKYQAEESVAFRHKVLTTLFSALNNADQPTPGLQSLTIKHLQNYNMKELATSANRLSVLSRLSELRLKIVTEYDHASPEASWGLPALYDFFRELPDVWLEPASQNLESLTIHADIYWGYIPKSDFRSLHFPKLRKLELGNYAFSHDWQLQWILSHGDTLEELILDNCPIVHYTTNAGPVDAEGYPTDPTNDFAEYYDREYHQKWSSFFFEFKEKLPKLKHFKFGSGDWLHEGKNFDGAAWPNVGLTEERYMVFDRGVGPSPWQSVLAVDQGPLNEEQDAKAYQDLMDIVKSRA